MKNYFFLAIAFLLSAALLAQNTGPILIETQQTALLLNVGSNQRVVQSYFGKKLPAEDYTQLKGGREVYLTAGMDNQFEPSIRMIHNDGNPSLELKFVSRKTETNGNITHTIIQLKDPAYPVEVSVHYMSYFKEDVIKTWTTIRHEEKKAVLLT
ncbi:MAG TPA: glycoside hydrolase family 36 N-terminal domain-containing protein, partial [Chitinophagaceae bacterium]